MLLLIVFMVVLQEVLILERVVDMVVQVDTEEVEELGEEDNGQVW